MNNISTTAVVMPQIAQNFSISNLPFVERGDKHSDWSVTPTGDYDRDYQEGRRYARRYVRALRASALDPFMLGDIVTAMPGEKGPIENGFLAGISIAAC